MKSETMRIVEKSCANWCGHCVIMDRACIYENDTANMRRCSYYEESVLPGNPTAEARYWAKRKQADNRPRCKTCNSPFDRKGPRHVYCTTCAQEAERVNRNKRAREYRLRNNG
jgi:hypothetical protein